MKKLNFAWGIVFFLLSFSLNASELFSSNEVCYDGSYRQAWNSQFIGNPYGTICDCFPQNRNAFFMAFSNKYQHESKQNKALLDSLLMQMQIYSGVRVKAEYVEVKEALQVHHRWINVSVLPLFAPISFETLKDRISIIESQEDTQGVANKFSLGLNLPSLEKLHSKLQYAKGPMELLNFHSEDSSYMIAVGVQTQLKTRSESWSAADQKALLELALSKQSTIQSERLENTNYETTHSYQGTVNRIDTTIEGFYVLARWCDSYTYYSLAICKK